MLAFDFETHAIAPARQLPPAVCMSWAVFDARTISASGVVRAAEGIEFLTRALDAGELLVGAETAFDVLVSCTSAADGDALLARWILAYQQGRVHDVLLRQKLLDLAAGYMRPSGYNLAEVVARHSDRVLDKENPWRTAYAAIEHLDPTQYPPEAFAYALEDALATAEAWQGQEAKRLTSDSILEQWGPGADPFVDLPHQMCAALALKAISAAGIRTDGPAVERLADDVRELHSEVRADLIAAGLVRCESSRDTQAIAERCARFGLEDAKKHSLENAPDHALRNLVHWTTYLKVERAAVAACQPVPAEWAAYAAHLEGEGLVRVEHKRNTKRAAEICEAAYTRLQREIPRTKTGGISLDVDACERSEDPLLLDYAEYASLDKTLSTDLPILRSGTVLPIHPRIDSIKETGRVSFSKPNLQNQRRLPGIRECFVPRAGHVFLDADYPMLELHTLAEVCYQTLGFSYLGDALRSGEDPHLRIASTILGRPYAELDRSDPVVDRARTAGKGVNFGAPGGLSPETFAHYAWKSYRIRMSVDEARVLIQQYKQTWREIPSYFRWIKSLDNGDGCYNVRHLWSGRLRAYATYCAACNSPFQGLGADVAKVALWFLFLAMSGRSEYGRDDPLYGCRQVNFVHDSNMLEVPETRIDACAERVGTIMHEAALVCLPTVGMRPVDVLVTRQWSKKAKTLRDAHGKLVPWDLREACREALAKGIAKGKADRETAFDYLTRDEWPRDVSREIATDWNWAA